MAELSRSYVAVDLGAGSGRVVVGRFGEAGPELAVAHRFANVPREQDGHERWHLAALFEGIREGLRASPADAVSIGVDTWGVDYGLLDGEGRLIADPVCYRDPRTEGAIEEVLARVPRAELFQRTGLQIQPFNTLYQLFAQVQAGEWPDAAARLLMMPDLFHHQLCGAMSGERTIASTSQLLCAATGEWDRDLADRVGIPPDVLPPLVTAGTRLGELRGELVAELGCPSLQVVAPGAHDTASAVAGTPLESGQAFLSSGTWSLLGVETPRPLVTTAVARQNLTNEGGVEGRNRLLQNIMGLWLLESCRRTWAAAGEILDYDALCARFEGPSPLRFVAPDDPRFFRPADMVREIRAYLRETGQADSDDEVLLSRIVLESLALRYAEVLDGLARVIGKRITTVRIIGGGAQNDFLNQATADATGRVVLAGPVEATALGNLVVQAIADRRFPDLDAARSYLREHVPVRRFEPRDGAAWQEARGRYAEVAACQ